MRILNCSSSLGLVLGSSTWDVGLLGAVPDVWDARVSSGPILRLIISVAASVSVLMVIEAGVAQS